MTHKACLTCHHRYSSRRLPRAVLITEPVAGAIGITFPNGVLVDDDWKEVGSTLNGIQYPCPHISTGDSTAPIMTSAKQAVQARFRRSNFVYGERGTRYLPSRWGM